MENFVIHCRSPLRQPEWERTIATRKREAFIIHSRNGVEISRVRILPSEVPVIRQAIALARSSATPRFRERVGAIHRRHGFFAVYGARSPNNDPEVCLQLHDTDGSIIGRPHFVTELEALEEALAVIETPALPAAS